MVLIIIIIIVAVVAILDFWMGVWGRVGSKGVVPTELDSGFWVIPYGAKMDHDGCVNWRRGKGVLAVVVVLVAHGPCRTRGFSSVILEAYR
ncbi:hypothetical protein ASPACDRAFT_125202 [Aspergillus aculeatus ATCC 16872]|uniref:Uncharacterized protein n=1 Tax=Aspergillus aculeatus (strain ATCC 16872 / CBS 172.66 / WB 5094) TaxID=690307 RepID=A0A1L9WK61_ASPA1|nr:uncharacterized protein ASPACDRAFT_125202 [Aspergillus aculeatus ATCC 16872]OJJ96543.1 hypothetical protein ASPACDRAFT_125202 [Aspergillus aculeatus ATCC 16872]